MYNFKCRLEWVHPEPDAHLEDAAQHFKCCREWVHPEPGGRIGTVLAVVRSAKMSIEGSFAR